MQLTDSFRSKSDFYYFTMSNAWLFYSGQHWTILLLEEIHIWLEKVKTISNLIDPNPSFIISHWWTADDFTSQEETCRTRKS